MLQLAGFTPAEAAKAFPRPRFAGAHEVVLTPALTPEVKEAVAKRSTDRARKVATSR